MRAVFLRNPCRFVESANFACDLYLKTRAIEARDSANAAFPAHSRTPESFTADPVRADSTNSGYSDTSTVG
jgi:hypothetical protein